MPADGGGQGAAERGIEMKTDSAVSEFTTGTCKRCGDKKVSIFRDNRLCEDCDSDTYLCGICKTVQHRDDRCRHIFQDHDFEWMGAGVGVPDKYQLERLKPRLFKLFSLMPEGFARDLRTAIKSGRFYTWMVAPLLGGGGILEMNGMPDRDGKFTVLKWGDALIEIGGGEHAEETADAYRWLVSLYKDHTPKANRATVIWIEEFLGPE